MQLPSHYNTSTNTKDTSCQLASGLRDVYDQKNDRTSEARAQLDNSPELETVHSVKPSEGERRTRGLGGQAMQQKKEHNVFDELFEVHCGREYLSVGLTVSTIDGGECR